ncbi:multi-sensor signal transduction histidine kinase [Solidesulfovibrio fructosivorans JJ]]|uniref:histidine kinase n=1 Tax=Solidesulfovibrio fructosivorans JJ] TaxID=596151 RepID=E1JXC7_SOLFR|nr:response regulator [Solidesulfovibrio fructosivorans]EFL50904.1 multi-sensor signal transduction histidine kinase [Solidesulfovibrio fructosivorans JJ]]
MSAHKPTLLTIDDEAMIRETIAAYMENRGFVVYEAPDGRRGLEVFRDKRPDLVLVDLRMPEMDGLEVLACLHEIAPDTPAIVVSGTGVLRDAVEAVRRGAWDYITKPIQDMAVLALAVDKALERADLKRAVRQAEQRYTSLVQNIPLLIFGLTRGLRLEFVNRGCRTLLGYTREEALAEPDWLLGRIDPELRDWVRGEFEACLDDCSLSFSRQCKLLHKDGRVVYGVLKSIPVSDCAGHGPRQRVEGCIMDIGDRMLLEKVLVQKEKIHTLGAIAAEVAHEIRNPLMAIGGFAKRLTRKMPELTEAGIILEEAGRLERFLNRIRDYLNPVRQHPEAVVMADVVRDCLALLAPELTGVGVTPSLDLAAAEVVVREDPDILSQVVINLIRFTLAALPPRGGMWLTARSGDGFVHLEIGGDQAHPVADAEKVFLPFDAGGETIGLPVCFRLMRSMGGALRFEQQGGKGRFVMSVLTAEARQAAGNGRGAADGDEGDAVTSGQ